MSEGLLKELKLDTAEFHKLERPQASLKPNYLIDSEHGRFFLKTQRPVSRRGEILRRKLLGSPAFARQLAVYEAFKEQHFTFFNCPALIKTDGQHFLLLEFIALASEGSRQVENFGQQLVKGLLEFQSLKPSLKRAELGNALFNLSISSTATIVRSAVTGLSRRYGLPVALKCLRVVAACESRQKKLKTPILLHNDFHHENIMIGQDGLIYITDFEKAGYEQKWVLVDIVHYAVGTHDFSIDLVLIKKYIEQLQSSPLADVSIILKPQLRVALLKRVMQHLFSDAPPKEVKRQYERFFLDVLLDERAYENWFRRSFS